MSRFNQSAPYRKGYAAAEQGRSLDACRFRVTARRIEWVRGYHQAKADMDLTLARHRIERPPDDLARQVIALDKLRKVITGN
jgi:ribosome modulation factor